MSRIFFIFLFLSSAVFAFEPAKTAERPADAVEGNSAYEKMAVEISSAALRLGIGKIAVLPFCYADSTSSVKDGSVISERLLTQLVKIGSLQISERSQLEKILIELKLENSGAIDSSSAKNIGKVLGAEALLSGTLVATTDGKVEINARLISTEDAKALCAFASKVDRDWLIKDKEKQQETDRRFLRMRMMRK